MICERCRFGKCVDEPTPNMSHAHECPMCDGAGCDECTFGKFEVTECPKRYARAAMPALFAESMADKGSWPVAGGWMDQTESLLSAIGMIRSDESRIKESSDG